MGHSLDERDVILLSVLENWSRNSIGDVLVDGITFDSRVFYHMIRFAIETNIDPDSDDLKSLIRMMRTAVDIQLRAKNK